MNTRPDRVARRLRAVAAVACVVLLGAVPTANATSTADPDPRLDQPIAPATISWSIGPKPEGEEPGIPRPSFFLDAKPGQTIKDSVRLRNLEETPIKLKVYATDALNTISGAQDLLPATEQPKDIGTWIKFETTEVELTQLQYVDIPFTLKVPDDAEPGDHTGGIVSTAQVVGADDSGTGVDLDRRLASRVAMRVDGPLSPELTISNFGASYGGSWNPAGRGSTDLAYRLTNTGNVRLSADQIVKVSGPLPFVSRKATLEPIPEILPGNSIFVTSTVSGVWPTIRSSAKLEIKPIPTREGDEFPALRSAKAAGSDWAVPWAFLLLVVAVAGGTAGVMYLRSHTQERQQQRIKDAVAAARAEDQAVLTGSERTD